MNKEINLEFKPDMGCTLSETHKDISKLVSRIKIHNILNNILHILYICNTF